MQWLKKWISPPQPVLVVSGLPRSGTSLMMKMVAAGGIPPLTDHLRQADADNPQGYYEFERVKNLDKGDTVWVADAQGKAVKVISQLLIHLPPGYRYKVIFMQRHLDEILASQKKMLTRRGEDSNLVHDDEMRLLFEKHLRQVLAWLAEQPHIETLPVHYRNLINFPQPQAEKINRFWDGSLDVAAMTAVIDPTLYRNRQTPFAS